MSLDEKPIVYNGHMELVAEIEAILRTAYNNSMIFVQLELNSQGGARLFYICPERDNLLANVHCTLGTRTSWWELDALLSEALANAQSVQNAPAGAHNPDSAWYESLGIEYDG